MKTFTNLLLTVVASSFILTACHKDCDLKHEITSKNLPVTGRQEVPQRETKAHGKMDVSYNKKTKVLSFRVRWNDLTGIPIGSHIHGEAPRGVNAGIVYGFTDALPKTTSGTFSDSVVVDEIAIKEAGLLAGLYYLNIHTPMFPGGEIRGQIEF